MFDKTWRPGNIRSNNLNHFFGSRVCLDSSATRLRITLAKRLVSIDNAFSSPGAALLLVSTNDRDFESVDNASCLCSSLVQYFKDMMVNEEEALVDFAELREIETEEMPNCKRKQNKLKSRKRMF